MLSSLRSSGGRWTMSDQGGEDDGGGYEGCGGRQRSATDAASVDDLYDDDGDDGDDDDGARDRESRDRFTLAALSMASLEAATLMATDAEDSLETGFLDLTDSRASAGFSPRSTANDENVDDGNDIANDAGGEQVGLGFNENETDNGVADEWNDGGHGGDGNDGKSVAPVELSDGMVQDPVVDDGGTTEVALISKLKVDEGERAQEDSREGYCVESARESLIDDAGDDTHTAVIILPMDPNVDTIDTELHCRPNGTEVVAPTTTYAGSGETDRNSQRQTIDTQEESDVVNHHQGEQLPSSTSVDPGMDTVQSQDQHPSESDYLAPVQKNTVRSNEFGIQGAGSDTIDHVHDTNASLGEPDGIIPAEIPPLRKAASAFSDVEASDCNEIPQGTSNIDKTVCPQRMDQNTDHVDVAPYSVSSVFPIVYEPTIRSRRCDHANTKHRGTKPALKVTVSRSPTSTTTKAAKICLQNDRHGCSPSKKSPATATDQHPANVTNSTRKQTDRRPMVQSLEKQVASLQQQLQNAYHQSKLRLNVSESERNKLAQRCARLSSQLKALTSDLLGSKAENARLATENALYASKLPALQAELLAETTQVDETQAQSVRVQLETTQLRAKAQVLQTRAASLDAQLETTRSQLRTSANELKRKTTSVQQLEERIHARETELRELKITHSQELMHWKKQLTTDRQRLAHDRDKYEHQIQKNALQHTEDTKRATNQWLKARKELEASVMSREQRVQQLKKEAEAHVLNARTQARELHTLEAQLRRAERTELALRNQLSQSRAQLRTFQQENTKLHRALTSARAVSRPTRPVPPRPRHRHQDGISDSFPKQKPDRALCECCEAILDITQRLESDEETAEPTSSPSMASASSPCLNIKTCPSCDALQNELRTMQDELVRARALHAREMKVQAGAYERVLASMPKDARRQASPTCA